MSSNLVLSWVLPTTRASGKPLAVKDIKHVLVEISVDNVTFGPLGTYPSDVLSTSVNELEVGTWYFRGVVVDTADRVSTPMFASYEVLDVSPPSPLGTLVVALA
jgi:hypothetical protein